MKVLEPNIDKINDTIFIAKTLVYKDGREIAISMRGKTEEIAKEKLRLFIQGKPYKHLD